MFRGIFDKREAEKQSEGAGLAPSRDSAQIQSSSSPAPIPVDQAMLAISRELSGLSQLPVSQAAKERGWAAVKSELEQHPVRITAAAGARPPHTGRARSWRWAIASAAAAVAVIATLLGTYSGGLLQMVDSGDQTTTITSIVSSDTTEPSTTVSTEGTTVSTRSVPTSEEQVGPVSTDDPVTTSAPDTTEVAPGTTEGSGPGTTSGPSINTTTTRPPSTTTTGEQLYTSAQREGSARTAAAYLADMVITGNTSGARALVAPEAQASLAQMVMSLNEPHGYRITGVRSLSDTTVRVTLEISDRVVSPNGELKEALPKFAIKVRVDDKGAVITAINAG
jgi:hypothetical protein